MSTAGAQSATSMPSYILAFLLVGMAWGLTTPFMRRAARARLSPPKDNSKLIPRTAGLFGAVSEQIRGAFGFITGLLRNPGYAVPLLLNLSGSVWFFLLIGNAELSLTVPIVNTLAFLFTVLGEWWVEGRLISRGTSVGMVLSLAGIALCVHSKSG